MATFISHSPAETARAWAKAWGATRKPGLVIGLVGDLGAGKTQLVKGLAKGLGISARVTSPTFALVNEYAGGRLRLFHLDLYRLDTRAQIEGAGLEDISHPPASPSSSGRNAGSGTRKLAEGFARASTAKSGLKS